MNAEGSRTAVELATGFGWLARDAGAPHIVEGVEFDGALPTRREEYNFTARQSRLNAGSVAWDAATGFIPHWHVLPYILAAQGYFVIATDHNPDHLLMAEHERVERVVHDLDNPAPLYTHSADLVCCISVLEHVQIETRRSFAAEAARVTCPGGMLIVTADEYDPTLFMMLFSDDFDVGDLQPDPVEQLTPRVAYVVGVRK